MVFLEQSSDPDAAFFSYDVDETGERGVIRANKEGLRLYAMELLKKSMTMENSVSTKPICFDYYPWLVSHTGYDLIAAVQPEYGNRNEILDKLM